MFSDLVSPMGDSYSMTGLQLAMALNKQNKWKILVTASPNRSFLWTEGTFWLTGIKAVKLLLDTKLSVVGLYLWQASRLYFFIASPSMLAGRSAQFCSRSLHEVVIFSPLKLNQLMKGMKGIGMLLKEQSTALSWKYHSYCIKNPHSHKSFWKRKTLWLSQSTNRKIKIGLERKGAISQMEMKMKLQPRDLETLLQAVHCPVMH